MINEKNPQVPEEPQEVATEMSNEIPLEEFEEEETVKIEENQN